MSSLVDPILGFFGRNRRKFYYLGGTVGTGYVLLKYAQFKWREFQQRREIEQTAKANVKRRFEQNLQDCTFAVASLLPTLGENLFQELNVEMVTAQLQQSRSRQEGEPSPAAGGKSKMELWDELKILSFTRTVSAVYLTTLLILFTHLQLNLLGRFFYLDSVVAFSQDMHERQLTGTAGSRRGVSDGTERKYLTFSWYILNVGWKRCVARVKKAVEEVVGSISLKEQVSFASLMDILEKVRLNIEADDTSPMTSFLLPEEGKEEEVLRAGGGAEADAFTVDAELRGLLDETRDFLESEDFKKVVGKCLDEGFDILAKQLKPSFFAEETMKAKSGIMELAEGDSGEAFTNEAKGKQILFAGVLPIVSRIVHNIVNGVPNVFVEVISTQPDLKAFSVVMYTGWDEHAL
ncbi:peroxin [Gaertneriomyces sp. JEL0708]|nr:peroxin [Gaertneriomyces sp. JEL0708]